MCTPPCRPRRRVHLHAGHGRAQRLAQERRVLLRSVHQHDAARLDARHERLHRAPVRAALVVAAVHGGAQVHVFHARLDLGGHLLGHGRRRGGVWPSAARRRARRPRRPRPPSRRHPPARWRRRRRRRLSSTAPRRARRRRRPPPPKSSTSGSQTSSGNMGALASAGTSNPSIRHRRRRSSAARVPAPEICATPSSDSAAAAAAGSSVWVASFSSTSIFSSVSFVFSASSSRFLSASALASACLLRRSSLRFRRHASSSAPSRSTRRDTATSSGFRAPGGCSASVRTRRARLCGAPRPASTTRFLGSSAHSAKSARGPRL